MFVDGLEGVRAHAAVLFVDCAVFTLYVDTRLPCNHVLTIAEGLLDR